MGRPTLDYLKTESGSGLVLAAAAAAALGIANSRLGGDYFHWLALPVPVRIGDLTESLSLAGWTRALLMPVFFLVLGMELKFELLRGELSNLRRLGLPTLAALGGLIGAGGDLSGAESRHQGEIWAAGRSSAPPTAPPPSPRWRSPGRPGRIRCGCW